MNLPMICFQQVVPVGFITGNNDHSSAFMRVRPLAIMLDSLEVIISKSCLEREIRA